MSDEFMRCYVVFVILLMGLLVGCGDRRASVYPVTGKFAFSDGSYPKFGEIEFASETEPPVIGRGRIQNNGTFEITGLDGRKGVIAGGHKIVIMQVVSNPTHGNIIHDHGRLVARKYAQYRTTDLRVEVDKTRENHFELVIDSLQ